MSEPAAPASIYQLKIVPRGVSPLVWRRVLVRSDTTIAQFHHLTQTVMGGRMSIWTAASFSAKCYNDPAN